MEVAGANRRWRGQFRCRGSRRESAVAFFVGHYALWLLANNEFGEQVR